MFEYTTNKSKQEIIDVIMEQKEKAEKACDSMVNQKERVLEYTRLQAICGAYAVLIEKLGLTIGC